MAVSGCSTVYRFWTLARQYHQCIVYIEPLACTYKLFFSLNFFPMFRLYKIWLQVYWVTEGCVTIISYHCPFSDANIFAFSCYILNQMEDDGVPMPASSSSFSRPQTYIIFLEIMEHHLLFWSIPHRDRNYHATVTLNPRKAQSSSKRKRRCSPVSRARWQANAE